ncbi:MAG TPA: type III pantothenate kinase [Gemmataceae bacterium]|nr:type III pantothenate kinase [Gemmataceae bacterium]
MSGPIVVDVGNSRIKWGLCSSELVWSTASLPPDDPAVWQKQWDEWKLQKGQEWLVAGVHPKRSEALLAWLHGRAETVRELKSAKQLPLIVDLEYPEKVGIDRLLNAVAANLRRQENVAAILIDAGTAVTVDYLDGKGAFKGGTIFPGFRLMASALHHYTALLPIVELDASVLPPGTSTTLAMQAGIYHAVLGGIERIITEYQHRFPTAFEIFLTGGDAKSIAPRLRHVVHHWPEMTLEGILHSRN